MSKKLPGVTRITKDEAGDPPADKAARTAAAENEAPSADAAPGTKSKPRRRRSPRAAAASSRAEKARTSESETPPAEAAPAPARVRRKAKTRKTGTGRKETVAPVPAAVNDALSGEIITPADAAASDAAAAAELHALRQRREQEAERIIAEYAGWSIAGGLVPIPIVDAVAIAAVQLRMLSRLARLYGVPLSQDRGKAVISAIAGGVIPPVSGAQLASTLMKSAPGIGFTLGLACTVSLANSATKLMGVLFARHFEKGGGLEQEDLAGLRQSFQDGIARARA